MCSFKISSSISFGNKSLLLPTTITFEESIEFLNLSDAKPSNENKSKTRTISESVARASSIIE